MRLSKTYADRLLCRSHALCLLALVLLVNGCGPSAPAPNAGAGAVKPLSTTASSAQGGAETSSVKVAKSVFIVDPKTSKDPFFPNSKFNQAAPAGATNQTPSGDLVSMLELKNVLTAGREKYAFVNNSTLEEGKTANISVVVNGKEQILRVKCLRILNLRSIDVKIDGIPQIVRLNKR
jgi:hypothetical protein